MNALTAQPGLWSIRCYRLMMRLYPAEFTNELGDSVDQAFRDLIRDAFRKRGYMGIVMLWFRTVPDFLFSIMELLTSTAGDYLKWYFRLRWILACALGFGAGSLIATALASAGVFEYFGLSHRWGLAGLPLWLSLGYLQSLVLSDRFCHRSRWVVLTVLGGVIAILGYSAFFPAFRLDSWTLLPVIATRAALVGGAMGFFQWFAFRRRDVPILRWMILCTVGAYISGLLSFPVSTLLNSAAGGAIAPTFISNATAGALLGLVTAGPLKRLLWPSSSVQALPSESAESLS